MKRFLIPLAALVLVGCDSKTYDDDQPLDHGIRVVVYHQDPPEVDLTRYPILDLAKTVSEPTESFVAPVADVVEPQVSEPVKERPIESFGSSVLETLGMKPSSRDDYAAGYRYARDLGNADTNNCRGGSIPFVDGCVDYMLEVQKLAREAN